MIILCLKLLFFVYYYCSLFKIIILCFLLLFVYRNLFVFIFDLFTVLFHVVTFLIKQADVYSV